MLNVLYQMPPEILDCEAHQLHDLLGGPTLLHLEGSSSQVIFISVLLHGNEVSGWMVVRQLLREYQSRPFPKSLMIFIGNTEAAAKGLRMLPHQKDFNRIWKDTVDDESYAFVDQLKTILHDNNIFVAIDVHNNTGMNPHYACVNKLENEFFAIAQLFGDLVVYFTHPDNVLSIELAKHAPSLTLECGKPGDLEGINKVWQLLEHCLTADKLPEADISGLHLFETVAVVKVPQDISVGFDEDCDIRFVSDIDHMNFRELAAGTVWGHILHDKECSLIVYDNNDNDVVDQHFSFTDNTIRSTHTLMPSMLTMRSDIIRQDCLCYLMKRINVDTLQSTI